MPPDVSDDVRRRARRLGILLAVVVAAMFALPPVWRLLFH
jgi:hypothetical protein